MIRYIRLFIACPFLVLGTISFTVACIVMGKELGDEFSIALEKIANKPEPKEE